ncbi:MAG TPA: nucleotidyltransferase family protein [Chloroflexota bacterium]
MIAAVVLAAGASTRMGQPKQLLRLGGESLVRRVTRVALAAGLHPVAVVVGHAADAVRGEVADLPVLVVENPGYARGQSTSLHVGLRAVAPHARAVVVLLADQPLVLPALLQRLVDAYQDAGKPIVVPARGGRWGNPVLLDLGLLPELLAIEGDQGARAVVRRDPRRVLVVEVDTPAIHLDVDTWEAYEAVLRGYPWSGASQGEESVTGR